MIRILLADDQNLLCEILKSSLEQEPDLKIVGRANNGQIALEKVEQLRPDIALIDIEMPVMDGLTATEKITYNFPETKVIVLSCHEDESHRNIALNAGAKSYLPKSTQANEIIAEIRLVYQEGRVGSPESELTEMIMKLDRTKQEIQGQMNQVQQQLNQVKHTEAELKQHVGKLETKYGGLSEEISTFKSDVETILNDIRQNAKDSNHLSTEIKRLQTLLEGQLSYIHNLNKRFKFLRQSFLIASGVAAIALLFSIVNLFSLMELSNERALESYKNQSKMKNVSLDQDLMGQ